MKDPNLSEEIKTQLWRENCESECGFVPGKSLAQTRRSETQ